LTKTEDKIRPSSSPLFFLHSALFRRVRPFSKRSQSSGVSPPATVTADISLLAPPPPTLLQILSVLCFRLDEAGAFLENFRISRLLCTILVLYCARALPRRSPNVPVLLSSVSIKYPSFPMSSGHRWGMIPQPKEMETLSTSCILHAIYIHHSKTVLIL